MIKQKVEAFTIMEVTVTMLITAIVIAVTFTSFNIILKYYGSVTKSNDQITALTTLDHLLRRDFDRADTIVKEADGISLKINSKLVRYEFAPYWIIRKAAVIDTFKETIQETITTFENRPVNYLKETDELNLIDELSFIINYKQEEIPFTYEKSYSSENLIQRNSNAIN